MVKTWSSAQWFLARLVPEPLLPLVWMYLRFRDAVELKCRPQLGCCWKEAEGRVAELPRALWVHHLPGTSTCLPAPKLSKRPPSDSYRGPRTEAQVVKSLATGTWFDIHTLSLPWKGGAALKVPTLSSHKVGSPDNWPPSWGVPEVTSLTSTQCGWKGLLSNEQPKRCISPLLILSSREFQGSQESETAMRTKYIFLLFNSSVVNIQY